MSLSSSYQYHTLFCCKMHLCVTTRVGKSCITLCGRCTLWQIYQYFMADILVPYLYFMANVPVFYGSIPHQYFMVNLPIFYSRYTIPVFHGKFTCILWQICHTCISWQMFLFVIFVILLWIK